MRPFAPAVAVIALVLVAHSSPAVAQAPDTVTHDKTFLTRRDAAIMGAATGATLLLSIWDDDIAKASQQSRFQDSSLHTLSLRISKVNETTLTAAGIITYGIARWTGAKTTETVALHATEAVVLASVASQIIRGPLGRARPYVTRDTEQYNFKAFGGFRRGAEGFDRRAFPSIHTSSGMAVATVVTMELHRRRPGLVPYVAPVLFTAGLLPGLVRIQLDQHWATDVFAGAVMGVFAGYKVVSYSYDHPDNFFDRNLIKFSVAPDATGRLQLTYTPF